MNDETKAAHTPTPWKLRTFGQPDGMPAVIEGDLLYHVEGDASTWYGRHVVTFPRLVPEFEDGQKADAAFIVKACNAHDDLLAALREIEQIAGAPRNSEEDFANIASFARVAIAKAKS